MQLIYLNVDLVVEDEVFGIVSYEQDVNILLLLFSLQIQSLLNGSCSARYCIHIYPFHTVA